ncbi:hypothetical protein [Anabaena azotica]|uniref:hypothetical protein n=1 Tax=Anabaena azotica TaxID=197653 RepID=UPI0039A45A1A
MFQLDFQPARNKDGLSKLNFIGVEEKEGVKTIIDERTGEEISYEWKLINLIFEVMGVRKGDWKKITISTNGKYSDSSILGKILNGMGFTPSAYSVTVDDEGFEVVEGDIDEDGFEVVNDEIGEEIFKFLKNNENRFFVGKVSKSTEGKSKGFWQINPLSLKPFNKKGGK